MRKKKRIKPRNPLVEVVKKIRLKIIPNKKKKQQPNLRSWYYDY